MQNSEKESLARLIAEKNQLSQEITDIQDQLNSLDLKHGNMSDQKSTTMVKASVEVPTWTKRNGQSDRESVMIYIRELKVFRDLKLINDDKTLIFTSLLRSQKMSIYEELEDLERNDINKFCEYLAKVYVGNPEEIRAELQSAKQSSAETYQSFFRRICALSQRVRDPNLKHLGKLWKLQT